MKVALLGGTVSGIFTARKLVESKGVSVDLFRNLFDPARSIHTPHPLCEYQSASFLLRKNDTQELQDEVLSWVKSGVAVNAPDFVAGRVGADGEFKRFDDTAGSRYRPRGGFMAMLDKQMASLPASINVRSEQLSKMEKTDAGEWLLHDLRGKQYGPYDIILCSHDALPRASRKASFKQLLESALPHTSAVIGCLARAVSASCMTAVVQFNRPLDISQDSFVIEGIPELQMAVRNPAADQLHRGLQGSSDTWTLVSTTAWAQQKRPNFRGQWDKRGVGQEMVRAFGRMIKKDISQHKLVVPTFHWMGCSAITKVSSGPACAWDPETRFGFCGDIFGGLGVAGSIASGSALAGLVLGLVQGGRRTAALPGAADWGARVVEDADDDIMSISGPRTGREEPQDGLDHTWPTAVKIARGNEVREADSLAKYRHRGVEASDRRRLSRSPGAGGRGQKVSLVPRSQAANATAGFQLKCQTIDEEGLVKVSGLPAERQQELLLGVFPPGAAGVCGGLYDPKTGIITGADGQELKIASKQEVSLGEEMGLHGNHAIDLANFDGKLATEILSALQSALEPAKNFAPDSIRVSFENMGNRTIRQGQTLCGWSFDGDRGGNRDESLKIMFLLGSSKVTWGFKYRKEDRESLDVQLQPGEGLVLFGKARSWVSAVTKVDAPRGKPASSFDFAHVTFSDHGSLKSARPEVYARIHAPEMPTPGDGSYKWMQYKYTVCSGSGEKRKVAIHGSEAEADSQEHEPSRKVQSRLSRRWKAGQPKGVEDSLAGA